MFSLVRRATPCATFAAVSMATRGCAVHGGKGGVNSGKTDIEDQRWLEAMIAEHEMSNEERYAAEKQRELIKKMMLKMNERTNEKLTHHKKVVEEHHEKKSKEVEDLKETIKKLQETVEKMEKK